MRMPTDGLTYYADLKHLPGQTPRVISMTRWMLAQKLWETRRSLRSARATRHKIGMAVPVDWTQHGWYGGRITALEWQLRDLRDLARCMREYL